MGDMPNYHVTNTSAKPDSPERRIYVNTGYVRSTHGALKLAHVVRFI